VVCICFSLNMVSLGVLPVVAPASLGLSSTTPHWCLLGGSCAQAGEQAALLRAAEESQATEAGGSGGSSSGWELSAGEDPSTDRLVPRCPTLGLQGCVGGTFVLCPWAHTFLGNSPGVPGAGGVLDPPHSPACGSRSACTAGSG
jgi:hypothetical protein